MTIDAMSRDDLPVQGRLPLPVTRRVLSIIHDPVILSPRRATVREHLGWNDPDRLTRDFIADVRECSYGYANYEVVERRVVSGFPVKADGYRYNTGSYLDACRTGRGHDPDGVDYPELIREFDIVSMVEDRRIDEVWLFGGPFFGYWESTMVGRGAFWCNSPAVAGTEQCSRRFVIMGFNYQRGVGEMLENLGHRAESILGRVFERTPERENLFDRFTRYDLSHPGAAECGNVHFAPNSVSDYDWGNPRPVPSRCDAWYRFPLLTGVPRVVTCSEWGNGDTRGHHRWWFRHFPHYSGETGGISWNWWEYVIDPARVATPSAEG